MRRFLTLVPLLLVVAAAQAAAAQGKLTVVHVAPSTDPNEFDNRNPVDVLAGEVCHPNVVLGQAIGPVEYGAGKVKVTVFRPDTMCSGDAITTRRIGLTDGGDVDVAIHPNKRGQTKLTRFDNGPTLAARGRSGTSSVAVRHVAAIGPVTVALLDETFSPIESIVKNAKQFARALEPGFLIIDVSRGGVELDDGEGLLNESTAYFIYFWGASEATADLHVFKRSDTSSPRSVR